MSDAMTGLTEEEHRLVMRVIDLQRVTDLRAEVADLNKTVLQAKDSLDRGAMSADQYAAHMRMIAPRLVESTNALNTVGMRTRDYRQNLIGLSYALNDAFSVQGGFQQQMVSMANNMPMMLAGFGGLGYALGALLPIVGAVGSSFKTLWDKMSGEDAKKVITAIDAVKAKLKEWEANPPVLPLDMKLYDLAREKLDKLQEAAAAFERSKRVNEGFDVGAQASAAVKETIGSEQLAKSIGQAMEAEGTTQRPEDNQALREAKTKRDRLQATLAEKGPAFGEAFESFTTRQWFASKVLPDVTEDITRIEEKIRRENIAAARDLAGLFAAGDIGAVGRVKKMAEAQPDKFGKEFIDAAWVLPGSPEELARMRAEQTKREADEEQAIRDQQREEATRRDAADQQKVMDRQADKLREANARINAAMAKVRGLNDPAIETAALGSLADPNVAENERIQRVANAAKPAALKAEIPLDVAGTVVERIAIDMLKTLREKLQKETVAPANPFDVEIKKNQALIQTFQKQPGARAARAVKQLQERNARIEKQKAAAIASMEKRKRSRQLRGKPEPKPVPGPGPITPQTIPQAAQAQIARNAATDQKRVQQGNQATDESRAAIMRFLVESQQTIAVLTNEIAMLHSMFTPAAQAQIRMKQRIVEDLNARRARTFTMLPEGFGQ